MPIKKILKKAETERNVLLIDIARIGREVGRLKHERAELLDENDLDGNDLAIMKINETLHNARRVLSDYNRRRECLDFMIDYIGKEVNGND